jgi:outer membrane protein assembly factor BamD
MKRARVLVLTALLVGACSGRNSEQAFFDEVASLSKEEVYAQAEAYAEKEKWEDARKYFSFLADSFPNDPLGRKASLRVADTFFVRSDPESLTEAQLRYRDFANRFPSDPNRAYALLMLGKCHFKQGRGSGRDLTPVREARAAFEQVVELFPDSPHAAEARELLASCLEDLARHELEVARYYLRNGRPEGARLRLEYLMANYPNSEAAREGRPWLDLVSGVPPAGEPAATPTGR